MYGQNKMPKEWGIADDIGTEVALCGVGVVLLKNQREFLCWGRIRLSLLDFSTFIITVKMGYVVLFTIMDGKKFHLR